MKISVLVVILGLIFSVLGLADVSDFSTNAQATFDSKVILNLKDKSKTVPVKAGVPLRASKKEINGLVRVQFKQGKKTVTGFLPATDIEFNSAPEKLGAEDDEAQLKPVSLAPESLHRFFHRMGSLIFQPKASEFRETLSYVKSAQYSETYSGSSQSLLYVGEVKSERLKSQSIFGVSNQFAVRLELMYLTNQQVNTKSQPTGANSSAPIWGFEIDSVYRGIMDPSIGIVGMPVATEQYAWQVSLDYALPLIKAEMPEYDDPEILVTGKPKLNTKKPGSGGNGGGLLTFDTKFALALASVHELAVGFTFVRGFERTLRSGSTDIKLAPFSILSTNLSFLLQVSKLLSLTSSYFYTNYRLDSSENSNPKPYGQSNGVLELQLNFSKKVMAFVNYNAIFGQPRIETADGIETRYAYNYMYSLGLHLGF